MILYDVYLCIRTWLALQQSSTRKPIRFNVYYDNYSLSVTALRNRNQASFRSTGTLYCSETFLYLAPAQADRRNFAADSMFRLERRS